MESVAKKLEVRVVHQEFAEVLTAGEVFELAASTGRIHARRAASCLIVPEVGDRVLCAVESRGDAFVLAVLERKEAASRATMELPERTVVRAAERLSLAANEGVDIVGGGEVRISSAAVEVTSLRTRLASRALEVVGDAVGADLGRVKIVAKSIDGMMERLSQRIKRSFRVVEETDQVKARHLDYAAETVAHFRGEHTVITAKDLVKVNGEQIHVG
jgi:hypothetical protein